MRFVSFLSGFVLFLVVFSLIEGNSDPRQRFEGLVGKTVQVAWRQIDRQARGRTMEVMRESSPQSNKPIPPGVVRVIISDQTGRVLYTPILQSDF